MRLPHFVSPQITAQGVLFETGLQFSPRTGTESIHILHINKTVRCIGAAAASHLHSIVGSHTVDHPASYPRSHLSSCGLGATMMDVEQHSDSWAQLRGAHDTMGAEVKHGCLIGGEGAAFRFPSPVRSRRHGHSSSMETQKYYLGL